MKRVIPIVYALIVLFTAACAGRLAPPAPPRATVTLKPAVLLPAGHVVTGIGLLRAEEQGTGVPFADLQARFQIAGADGVWRDIGGFERYADNAIGDSDIGLLGIRWDSTTVKPGDYRLRVGTRVPPGVWQWSAPVPIVVNRAPVGAVSVKLLKRDAQRAVASFMAETQDVDGKVADVQWDFGDGGTARGPAVTHTYSKPRERYDVTVVLVDDRGATSSLYYVLRFYPEIVLEEQRAGCICQRIAVRKTGMALGPDAKLGEAEWPPQPGYDDGKTLGPRHDNPGSVEQNGEEPKTGYLFEILAEVTGTPSACMERQLVKGDYFLCGLTQAACDGFGGTRDAAGCCRFGTPWTGTQVDLDQDGDNDIDVSTKDLCEARGGRWDDAAKECSLNFPKSGGYKPDTLRGPVSGYDAPDNVRKAHSGTKVVFFDSPSAPLAATNGSTFNAEFLTYLRGSDNKYCYARSELKYERKAGKDDEALNVLEERAGADALPGI